MEKGLVSIITPMYNGEKYIAETIESVISQTYPQWEMLIIDDGSKDRGPEIVSDYSRKDSRITLYTQSNQGSANARNNGMKRAQGQYIALLDADDVWLPEFLNAQIALLKEKNALIVYASYARIDENSKEILSPWIVKSSVTYQEMLKTNYISCLTGLYDISLYGKIYLREELKSVRDDYAYWLDIMKLTGIAYGNKAVLAKYRVISSSTTGNKLKLIKKHFNFYYQYQQFGILKSLYYTIYWGMLGLKKFYKL